MIVLGFLFLLALKALPAPFRLGRICTIVAGPTLTLTCGFAVYPALSGILWS